MTINIDLLNETDFSKLFTRASSDRNQEQTEWSEKNSNHWWAQGNLKENQQFAWIQMLSWIWTVAAATSRWRISPFSLKPLSSTIP